MLEVGCGAGITAVALAQRGLQVCATDAVAAMVDRAQTRAADSGVRQLIEFKTSDVHALDFDDATFDLVIALGVLPWLHSPSDAVDEMARVLKPGQRLIASVNNSARLQYLLDPSQAPSLAAARRAIKKTLRIHHQSGVPEWQPHSCAEFEGLLNAAGLNKEDGRTFGFGPFTFLGRQILPDRIGVLLHERLQRLADGGQTGLKSRGAQYMVIARKAAHLLAIAAGSVADALTIVAPSLT